MNFSLHFPASCSCPACIVAATPAGAANIAAWEGFAAKFPADPFAPTVADLDALNEDADRLLDLVGYDPFAEDAMPLFTDGEWAICPLHGFHDAADNGEPLSFCEKCEERN